MEIMGAENIPGHQFLCTSDVLAILERLEMFALDDDGIGGVEE
jgi:hypothetical protein